MGSDTLTAAYTPDSDSSPIYTSATGSAVVAVTVSAVTPTITWNPAGTIIFGDSGTTDVLTATVNCTSCGTITYTATPNGGSATSIVSTAALAPNTYTITATFNPGSNVYSTTSATNPLTVSGESVWILNGSGGPSELAGNGADISPSADPGEGTAMAIDSGGNIWTVGSGSLEEVNQVGTLKQTISTGGGLDLPTAIAIDGNSQVWVTNGNNSVSEFSNSGTPLSPSAAFTDTSLSEPTGIAIDLAGSVWVVNQSNNSVTRILGVAAPVAPLSTAAANNTTGAKP